MSGHPIGPIFHSHSTTHNIPEECRSHLHRGESLKTRDNNTISLGPVG